MASVGGHEALQQSAPAADERGHLAVLGYEQARHKLRRARGYRGPLKRVDLNKLLPATYAVVAIFTVLTLVLAAADIVNPISLG